MQPVLHNFLTRVVSFSSTVGQFVLVASLRSQVNPENKDEFKDVSPERYVYYGSVYVRPI